MPRSTRSACHLPACLQAWLRAGFLPLTLCSAAALPIHVDAAPSDQGAISVEHSVKAAFLYKFLGYVEFPAAVAADAGAPFTIGVAGADDIADELVRISVGRNVDGHSIVVRTVRDGAPLTGVQMLFVAGADTVRT